MNSVCNKIVFYLVALSHLQGSVLGDHFRSGETNYIVKRVDYG